ncbi:MAG: hypothetical protein LUQ13_01965, partial [Methanomicrobiales archaeon]|nr:hypothetical protein [Methanomicrobiales archaeon]
APGRRPLYISPGNYTDFLQAAEIVRATILPGRGYPEPLADARRCARVRASTSEGQGTKKG